MYKKQVYFLGQLKTNDVILAHPSISRNHACVICDSNQNALIVDLGSKGGTFINQQPVEELTAIPIVDDDVITFAASTRSYQVSIDYSGVQNTLYKQEKELKRELAILEKIDNPDISRDDLRSVLGFTMEDTIYVGNIPFGANQKQIKE